MRAICIICVGIVLILIFLFPQVVNHVRIRTWPKWFIAYFMCSLVLLKWHLLDCYLKKLEACKRKKDHQSCHKPCYLRLHRWSKCILFFHFISVTATGRMTTLSLAFFQILGMATLTSLLYRRLCDDR